MKIYRSASAEKKIMDTYDKLLLLWGVPVEEKDILTFCGITHVLVCGNRKKPPLVLFHGTNDDSALAWIFNAKELAQHFHVYAVDTMGGPGKSRPNRNYVQGFDALRWLDETFEGLELKQAFVAGVSAGAYLAQYYGAMRPEKVQGMICMSRTDILAATAKNPVKRMLKVFMPEAAFPSEDNIKRLIRKLAGDNYEKLTCIPIIREHYKYLLTGFNNLSMTFYSNVSFSESQLSSIRGRALFLNGESDPLTDVESLKQTLMLYRQDYRFFPGAGHMINHVMAPEINRIMIDYFSKKAN